MLSSGHKTKGGRRTRGNKLSKAGVVRWNVGDGDGAGALSRRPGAGVGCSRPEKARKYLVHYVSTCYHLWELPPPSQALRREDGGNVEVPILDVWEGHRAKDLLVYMGVCVEPGVRRGRRWSALLGTHTAATRWVYSLQLFIAQQDTTTSIELITSTRDHTPSTTRTCRERPYSSSTPLKAAMTVGGDTVGHKATLS